MKLIFLGTNGWYDTPAGNTLCVLLRCRDTDIVLDAGSGFQKLDRYPAGKRRTSLFLSHLHLDHIIGLHTLPKLRFPSGLDIVGPEGTKKALGNFLDDPFTIPAGKLGFELRVSDISEGRHRVPVDFECRKLLHAGNTLGYRLEMEGRTVTFCTDTGYCQNALELASGADVLLAECSLLPGMHRPNWPHLNPEEAANLALRAGAKKLFLLHFDASLYPDRKARLVAQRAARRTFGNAVAAMDGMEVRVG
jgi:ribonuclease BN (tRNA processing enzyme)